MHFLDPHIDFALRKSSVKEWCSISRKHDRSQTDHYGTSHSFQSGPCRGAGLGKDRQDVCRVLGNADGRSQTRVRVCHRDLGRGSLKYPCLPAPDHQGRTLGGRSGCRRVRLRGAAYCSGAAVSVMIAAVPLGSFQVMHTIQNEAEALDVATQKWLSPRQGRPCPCPRGSTQWPYPRPDRSPGCHHRRPADGGDHRRAA